MAKIKSAYFCQSCGHNSPKWLGKCPSCGEWNTFVEEVVSKPKGTDKLYSNEQKRTIPHQLNEVTSLEKKRFKLSDNEFNRVLGGGLVIGSITLIGGEPGIGKSTLLLDVAVNSGLKALYISGEESEEQIKLRAERLGASDSDCYLLTETNVQNILHHSKELQPNVIIVDSIQTLHTATIESAPGSISQIRECTAELLRYSKTTGVPIILIGHITKDGAIAGPKILEHMVDTVLQFEGDRNHVYRLLRSIKNRFGSTNELGIYEMSSSGMRQVENPSEILISNFDSQLSGVAIAATLEGIRPMLIEVQALTSTAAYGTPQRTATGFDLRRLHMLLAVLEKRCGFRIGQKDVFINLAGGIKVDDPSIDLAVVCAILSSNVDIPIESKTCFAAEVGLSGEIRPVPRVEQRISEAEKLGYKRIFISKHSKGITQGQFKIKLVAVGKIEEVLKHLFG
ncbi:DNA repair protein RadA [Parvicella tangerina]|uniref:DNA repair protein RadA n=1 Tax=Parvicella tangerina TaxID=2829795 RepID=A0A916JR49_9FLAO|nr:DNA repair protein RadA [Parvicella tangerina]CAG5087238.1 DNA repair protein RadA [Parvicella tangerina]